MLEEAQAVNAHPFTEDAVTREGAYLHRPDPHPVARGSPTLPTTGVGPLALFAPRHRYRSLTTRCTSTRRSGKDSCHRLICRHFAVPPRGSLYSRGSTTRRPDRRVAGSRPRRRDDGPVTAGECARSSTFFFHSLCAGCRCSRDLMPRSTWRPTKPAVYPLSAVESVHAEGHRCIIAGKPCRNVTSLSGRCGRLSQLHVAGP